MPSDKFGGSHKRVFVHEKPSRPSHAASKIYVDETVRNMEDNLNTRLERELKRLSFDLRTQIAASTKTIQSKLSKTIDRLKDVNKLQ